jgi:hypothetical protein
MHSRVSFDLEISVAFDPHPQQNRATKGTYQVKIIVNIPTWKIIHFWYDHSFCRCEPAQIKKPSESI